MAFCNPDPKLTVEQYGHSQGRKQIIQLSLELQNLISTWYFAALVIGQLSGGVTSHPWPPGALKQAGKHTLHAPQPSITHLQHTWGRCHPVTPSARCSATPAAAGPTEMMGRPRRSCNRRYTEQEASVLAAWETASSLKSSNPGLQTKEFRSGSDYSLPTLGRITSPDVPKAWPLFSIPCQG